MIKSYFSIITETIFFEEDTIFFSEKLWKPISNYHPFILVAKYGSLNKLKELGYKTFSPYINENYDSIENNIDRMLAIITEMKRLNALSINQLNDLYYNKLIPICKYNRDWFYKENHKIAKLLQNLIKGN